MANFHSSIIIDVKIRSASSMGSLKGSIKLRPAPLGGTPTTTTNSADSSTKWSVHGLVAAHALTAERASLVRISSLLRGASPPSFKYPVEIHSSMSRRSLAPLISGLGILHSAGLLGRRLIKSAIEMPGDLLRRSMMPRNSSTGRAFALSIWRTSVGSNKFVAFGPRAGALFTKVC